MAICLSSLHHSLMPEYRVNLQTYIIDQIEHGTGAVLEDDRERTLSVAVGWLPQGSLE